MIVFPILIHKTSTHYGDNPDISIRFRKFKMTGTMTTVSYTLDLQTKNKKFQWSFVWRPSVTKHWWRKG